MTSEPRATGAWQWPTGVGFLDMEEVQSTQTEALRLAGGGERGPLWIRARRQTQGRGRSGRGWDMPVGNLAATLLLAPGAELRALPGLALVAGVAVHDTVAGLLPPATPVRLKWPNDVLIGWAKVSGMLIETSVFGTEVVAAVGIGINIAAAPEIPGREATALSEHLTGRCQTPGTRCSGGSEPMGQVSDTTHDRLDPADVLVALADRMAYWLAVWSRGEGFSSVRTAWLERSGPIGEPIRVNGEGGIISGSFAGLDADGALLVAGEDGATRRVTFGDVALG